jgi:predicted AlkP superfamily pyrophosphatase or phosphodiesterase
MRATSLAALAILFSACGPPQSPAPTPIRRTALVLVSIDGFRPDYLDRPEAVELRSIARHGVRARSMEPVFPSKTFPNHYTLVTGLYPEHHGIVANTMEDPAIGDRFALSNRAAVGDSRWWRGEPIWATAERQGQRAAAVFWPGSEAPIDGVRPTWWARYDGTVPYGTRVAEVLARLGASPDSAAAFATLYLEGVDEAGHRHGPAAPETGRAIARADSAVGALWSGLAARGLRDGVNLLIVSDHGMVETSRDQVVFLDDALEAGSYRVVDWNPVAMIVPALGKEEEVFRRLSAVPHLTTWRRTEIPERYHFRDHPRITPIVAVADEGYTITTRQRFASALPGAWANGMHGYDNQLPSMGALFVAAGPAFPAGREVARVRSVDLYALMTSLLGLKPAPNDGSLDSIRVVLKGGEQEGK